jgi:hypothetical protein
VEKPRRIVFSFGLGAATALRALEVYRPESERIYDARFDHALLPGFWRILMLPGIQHSLRTVLDKSGMGTPGMLWCRTFFIWEGVTQYITAEAVDATPKSAASAASGSQIAFTYVNRRIIDGSRRSQVDQQIMSRVRRRGMPWVFGLDPAEVEEWLERRGYRLLEHAGASDYRARYLAPVGRKATIYEGEKMVLAEVVGEQDEALAG